jgi:hypothetical protein
MVKVRAAAQRRIPVGTLKRNYSRLLPLDHAVMLLEKCWRWTTGELPAGSVSDTRAPRREDQGKFACWARATLPSLAPGLRRLLSTPDAIARSIQRNRAEGWPP